MRNFITSLLTFVCCLSTLSISADDTSRLVILIDMKNIQNEEEFSKKLDAYYNNLSKKSSVKILASCDLEQAKIDTASFNALVKKYPNLHIASNEGKSKPETINAGLNEFPNQFDIVLVTSSELEPAVQNFDKIIVDTYAKNFANSDGVLNISAKGLDGINQAPVIGKKYIDRFNYIYNPTYKDALFDHELTYVSRILGKEAIQNVVVLKDTNDASQKPVNLFDQLTFSKRRKANFEISDATLNELFPKDWSILICTLDERKDQFARIYNNLKNQIAANNLEDKVEILYFLDNRQNTVGFKRNDLLKRSKGKYINFVDDDDDVSDNYIRMLHSKMENNPDALSLIGIITFNSQNPKIFIHSLKYDHYFEENDIYYRPPNHLNPIKRTVGVQFLFPSISHGEDTDWAMRIQKSHLLTSEAEITKPYYFYKFIDNKPY